MTHQFGTALRRLRGTPGFTAIAVVALAAGIGLNILIFSFTSPVLFDALPYPEAGRLLDISMAPPGRPEAKSPLNHGLYGVLRDRTGSAFEAVGVFDAGRTANMAGGAEGAAERLAGHRISATGLAALGAQPLIGRLPLAADEQTDAAPTMVLGYPLWQRRFAGRPDVVGQTVSVDGQDTQILAVMPEGFGLLDGSSDAWFTSGFEPRPGQETERNLRAIGRLKPGVSMEQAQTAVNSALAEYAEAYPNRDKGWTVELTPWREARFGGMRGPLTMVQLGVGAILLLLCVSVAVLMRARTVLSARTAVLDSTRTSAGVVLAEVLILAASAAVAAVVVTAWVLPALREITPTAVPRLAEVGFDATVLVFAVILIAVVTLAVGFVPALRASRASTATRGWGGAMLLVVLAALQVTLAFVLVAGTTLAVRAVADLEGRDVGINPAGLLSADVHLPRTPYVTPFLPEDGSAEMVELNPAGPGLYDRVRAALQTMPGVVQVAGVGNRPFTSNPLVQYWTADVEHLPENRTAAQYQVVTENYLNTMGIRLVRGRDFAASDQLDSPWVVLVNETLARQQWPDGEPIGQNVTLTFFTNDTEPAREVVGLVADTIPFRGASEVPPLIYVLHRQQATVQRASLENRRTVMSFILRTPGDPVALGDSVRATVGNVDPTTPVAAIRTVDSYLDAGQTVLFHYGQALLGILALVAVVAAAVCLHALTAYGAAHRQPVIPLGVLVATAVLIGTGVGWVGWMRFASVIESFLTNLSILPTERLPLVVTGCAILVTALVVFLLTIRRATRRVATT